ncbi:phage tail tape measure protein [Salibacterium salarium]|uniref:Phage tail tape measure protein n=1 Tax=Salibacterium salarium TaxID=284579 RepID=A0A3R9NYT5_9BACI|nr:phage tail tape measure protein [Salibacterium salarium]RSL29100.1 phage tail tape measure protein [Salibacterium salarium]
MAYDLTARLRLKDDMSGKLRRAGRNANKSGGSFRKMGAAAAGAAGSVIALGGAIATSMVTTSIIRMGATFDTEMGRVSAVTGATGDELDSMRAKAKEMGETTMFSATQSAEAIGFLGMAGFETNEIMASVEDTMALAAAGQLELGRAADISSNILSGFNLEAEEMGRVSDVLAKAAASANTDVEQLGGAMSYVAPVAASMGMSIEDTAGAIGILSNAGIQGQRAGTALRGMFSQLQMATGRTADKLEELGVSTEDVNPSVNSLSDILETLSDAGADSSDAMALVGQEAGPALARMLSEGSEGLDEMIAKMEDSEGAAQEMSDTVNDNLMGDFRKLRSAIEGVGLEIYERMEPALRDLTQQAKDFTGVASAFISFLSGDKIEAYDKLSEIFGVINDGKGDVRELSQLTNEDMLARAFGDEGAQKVQNMIGHFQTFEGILNDVVSWLEDAYQSAKDVANYVIDNWPQIKTTVMTVVGAFIALRLAILGITIVETITKLIYGFTTALAAAKFAVWAFNTALYANPIAWIVGLIVGFIAVLVLLYIHVEDVRDNMISAWRDLKRSTAIVWNGIKSNIVTAINGILRMVNKLIDALNLLPKVDIGNVGLMDQPEMPSVVAQETTSMSPMAYRGVDGSNYSGLDNVPYDGYVSRLHKDEAVLDRDDAKEWREGKSGGGNNGAINVNFNGDMHVRSDDDIDRLAKSFARELRKSQEKGA